MATDNRLERYYEIDEDIRKKLDLISICHPENCPVVRRHEYYPIPNKPQPPYFGKRPMLPVVPTWVNRGGVMILGMYPTARFANVPRKNGQGYEKEVPVRDIDEPFEDTRYFDGYGIRDVHSGEMLWEYYVKELEFNPATQLWMTNMVKCMLLKPGHIDAYRNVGWDEPPVQETRAEGERGQEFYFETADLCVGRNLQVELDLCQPELILTMGAYVCGVTHGAKNPAEADIAWEEYKAHSGAGILLKNDTGDSRTPLFQKFNVVHLHHPSILKRFNVLHYHEANIDLINQFLKARGFSKP